MNNKLPPVGTEIEIYLSLSNTWFKTKVTEHRTDIHLGIDYFLTEIGNILYMLTGLKHGDWRYADASTWAFNEILGHLRHDPSERLTEALRALPDNILSDLADWIK